ncbi:MAG TPA: hypothetical protein VET65_03100 [Candidatus Limnocylindrales bacterium]|nr:hypothetical protein [Candidatus Limnocylindrales bacterium]
MTTSSSETSRGARCTRISPSAILDDRLTGRDLDWARDHLRRCDTCRDRIDDFQEMRLRLERLGHAPVGPAAIEDALLLVVPDALRPVPSQARLVRGVPTAAAASVEVNRGTEIPTLLERGALGTPGTTDIASVPDLLSELEQEIFRDRSWGDDPSGLLPGTLLGDEVEQEQASPAPLEEPPTARTEPPQATGPLIAGGQASPAEEPPKVDEPVPALREVPVESGLRPPPDEPALPPAMPAEADVLAEPDLQPHPQVTPAGPSRSDRALRLAVGLGAAACVLLAALLYESGWILGPHVASVTPQASPSAPARHSPTSAPTIRATATQAPTPTPAVVLATLGDGVTGESVFRIRPGTAVPTYTRLVFDLTGRGLPTMVVAQPDPLHLQVTFRSTGGASVPVGGIHSPQVSGLEPAVQQGPDLVITIDLAHPVRLTDFTLPPAAGYAPRLVLDLHNP